MNIKYIVVIIFLIAGTSQNGFANNHVDECTNLFANRKYTLTRQKAEELIADSQKSDNPTLEMIGSAMHVMASVLIGDSCDFSSKLEFITSNLPSIKEQKSTLKSLILSNKALGLYHHIITQDYSQAANYNFKALEYSRKAKDSRSEIELLSNISSLYFLRSDTTGICYAYEAYAKSKECKYMPGLYSASVNISNFLYNKHQYNEALTYLNEGIAIADNLKFTIEKQYIYSFLGDIYAALQNHSKAEKSYQMSITDMAETSNYDKLYARLCFAIFLKNHKRYNESLNFLNEIRELSQKWNINTFDKEIALFASEIYENIGLYNNALLEYKLFDSIKEVQLNAEKEKEFSILDLKYKITEEKRKNAQQEAELLRKDKNLIVLSFIIAILVISAVVCVYLYNKTQKRYKIIVQTHLEKLEEERKLKHQYNQAIKKLQTIPDFNNEPKDDASESKSTGKYTYSALSKEKNRNLFDRLETIMNNDKIYHDANLTIDKLAQILNTNRSYLSQVINENTSLSYSSYINNYRIKEAIELLSDNNNDEPIKSISFSIGYNSPSNFFTIFKNKVGMSPSVYRENVQKINKNNTNNNNL